ncbi:hypothetical protein KEM55_005082, partial [Ascosphaera atra]
MHGLTKFNTYLAALYNQPGGCSNFSGEKLISIMNSFKDAFCHHFHSEIDHIADLAYLEPVANPAPDALSPEDIGRIFAAWGKRSIMQAGLFDVVPFLFLNFDRTAEEGMWKDWPPMPAPIRWALINLGGAWYSG